MQQVSYTIAGRPLEVIGADDKPVPRRARVADILALASKLSGVAVHLLKGTDRLQQFVRVRWAIYAIAREHGHSFPMIGRMVCRDHSTVVHGCRRMPYFIARNAEYAEFVAALRTMASDAIPFGIDAPAPPVPIPPIVEAEEVMVWCPQCDARVHRASALACAKPFCPQP